jgi:hypothetical protein
MSSKDPVVMRSETLSPWELPEMEPTAVPAFTALDILLLPNGGGDDCNALDDGNANCNNGNGNDGIESIEAMTLQSPL